MERAYPALFGTRPRSRLGRRHAAPHPAFAAIARPACPAPPGLAAAPGLPRRRDTVEPAWRHPDPPTCAAPRLRAGRAAAFAVSPAPRARRFSQRLEPDPGVQPG